jgi:hypothetical protein
MAEPQNIKHTLELSVPAPEVEQETERVVESIRKKVRLPGFRPGKVPVDIVRRRYDQEIRHDVLEKLIPRHFFKRAEEEGLNVVGTPNVSDVQFTPGEPLRFKAEFEVAPEIELKEYKGLTVAYQDPEVPEEDVTKRLDEIHEHPDPEGEERDPEQEDEPVAAPDHGRDPRPTGAGATVVLCECRRGRGQCREARGGGDEHLERPLHDVTPSRSAAERPWLEERSSCLCCNLNRTVT